MPLRRCAGSSAQASLAFTRGCARSHPDRTARRRTPSCAGTSAASLRPSAGSMARPASTPNCAGKGADMRDAGSSRLMRDMGLQAQRGRRRRPETTDSRHDLPIAPNRLGRPFVAERPDTVWLADISYIPTDEGFLYLAAIKDLATREIVGWSMADHLKAGLCIDALVMALQRCRPPRGLIHHSDRGVQYAAGPYRAVLERHGIQQSMSRRGNCLDNAPMESFFASLKTERIHEARFRTRAEARAAVFEYIEVFYNRQRLHSALGYRTPAEARASMEAVTMREAA